MSFLAHVIKDLGHRSAQWVEVPFKFGCLSGLATIMSLITLLLLAWALVLIGALLELLKTFFVGADIFPSFSSILPL